MDSGVCSLGAINTPPYKPEVIVPTSTATQIEVCPPLRWKSGDFEGQDLTFTIYFNDDESKVKTDDINVILPGTPFTASSSALGNKIDYSFTPSSPTCPLNYNTIYYWRVIVNDNL